MTKDDSYKTKFSTLEPWALLIFQGIKKDLRNDHLLKTPAFAQKHFAKRALDKLTHDEFAAAYLKEIGEGDEDLGEKVAAHWVLKNAEIYQFFAEALMKVNPNYEEIKSIPHETAVYLLNTAVQQFGATTTYIFCILNAVVISPEQRDMLRELAVAEGKSTSSNKEVKASVETVDALKEQYEKEIRKLVDKYEKRVQGIERKYIQDVDGLKKQISQLHKKIAEKSLAVG